MIPQTRTDLFLAKITGEDVTLPVPQTRFEIYLANIAGESYELPIPNSRATLYLAKILGQDVELPEPQTRSELYLASIAGMSVQLPAAPQTREEWYLARWAEDAGYVVITGNPVSFQAVAARLKQLRIEFSPVQDLHGYANPWPAGGGKNKLHLPVATYEKNGVTIKVNADGSVNISGEATINVIQSIGTFETGAADYLINGGPKPYANTFALVGIAGSSWYTVNSDDGRALPQNSTVDITIYVVNGIDTGNVTIYPMIRPASVTDPAFAPYSNECPISGWSEVTGEQAGKNLWNKANVISAYIDGSSQLLYSNEFKSIYIQLKPNVTYTLRQTVPSAWSNRVALVNSFSSGEATHDPITKAVGKRINAAAYTLTFTNTDFKYLLVSNYRVSTDGNNFDAIEDSCQLEIGDEATTYEAPNIRTFSVQLGDTYYSGWVDLITGVMRVTGKTWSLPTTGWALWQADTHHIFAHDMPNDCIPVVASGENAPFGLCTMFKPYSGPANNFYAEMSDGEFSYSGRGISSSPKIYVKAHDYADTTEFTAAISGARMYYLLAEPIEIQLTPQQISSLAGTNTMWTDADTLTVEYRKDGNVSDAEALGILLGGRYTPAQDPDDVPDREALRIITGR